MEKSKIKIMPSLEESIEIVRELKMFHSSYYGDAVDVVLEELTSLQASTKSANTDTQESDAVSEQE